MRRHAAWRQRQNMLEPNKITYNMSAIQPPRAPRPNCGRPSIQPCPGAKISVCASGTKKNQDNTSAVAAGTRVSPAPRRQKLYPRYRPSNTW